MSIGARLRGRREALGMTQQQLAGELGVTHQHVSRVESNHAAPSLELIVKLTRALGVTADFLLTGDERPAVDAVGAIRGEPDLSAAAKKHLIGLVQELRS